ncbi:MAG: hypothetical protein JRG93_09550, partial [Deltaproteobacteria bacterium]|nr:hypothetical protein [Deltaproteobacteria bacterium]
PVFEGALFGVSVTVTNPTETETVNEVNVEIDLPTGIARLFGAQVSTGGICTSTNCVGGQNINWAVGSLGPGESRVVSIEASAAAGLAGSSLTFDARVTASNANSANAQATADVTAARTFNLRMVENANPVGSGQSLTYTLHYANGSNSTINNVELTLTTPTADTTVTDAGGGSESGGVITWDLGTLNPGEGGTQQAIVTVDAAVGEQVRTQAVIFDTDDPLDQTRATVQTPVGESPLVAFLEVNQDPARQNELGNLSVTVTNPSTLDTRNEVTVQLHLPQGIARLFAPQISTGGICTSTSCVGGQDINWAVGSLGPGESRVVSIEPTVLGGVENGALIDYEVDVRVNSATAVQQTAVLAGGVAAVRGDRTFNLRVVENANPVGSGQSLTYTLHYANGSDSTINNVELTLTTPTADTTVTNSGGGSESGGVITWDLGTLNPGEGGTQQAVVTVDAAVGEQVRTHAVIFDTDDSLDQTRATVQTPVGESTLTTTLLSTADSVPAGQGFTITVTVQNVSATVTENEVVAQLQLSPGIARVFGADISGGGACSSTNCVAGQTITWDVGSLTPGQSTAMDLEVDFTVAGVDPGFILYFESETTVGDSPPEPRVVAATTVAVEPAP